METEGEGGQDCDANLHADLGRGRVGIRRESRRRSRNERGLRGPSRREVKRGSEREMKRWWSRSREMKVAIKRCEAFLQCDTKRSAPLRAKRRSASVEEGGKQQLARKKRGSGTYLARRYLQPTTVGCPARPPPRLSQAISRSDGTCSSPSQSTSHLLQSATLLGAIDASPST